KPGDAPVVVDVGGAGGVGIAMQPGSRVVARGLIDEKRQRHHSRLGHALLLPRQCRLPQRTGRSAAVTRVIVQLVPPVDNSASNLLGGKAHCKRTLRRARCASRGRMTRAVLDAEPTSHLAWGPEHAEARGLLCATRGTP